MPELPEVEVVRRGLARWVTGRAIERVEVLHPRAVRRHAAGAVDLVGRLRGRAFRCVSRRGKFLWLPLVEPARAAAGEALVAHLGMSGQLLVQGPAVDDPRHLRVRIAFSDDYTELRFSDQRTFGGLAVEPLVSDGATGLVPASVAHIARDPLDPSWDEPAAVRAVRSRSSEIKRVLLDQTVVSGIGNIYADEALWRARLHGRYPARRLSAARARDLLRHASAVMTEALHQGGTSFDELYVNVNGESGFFDVRLAAYGRAGRPCPRCGATIRRERFMNRSSYLCPQCQRAPR